MLQSLGTETKGEVYVLYIVAHSDSMKVKLYRSIQ